MLVVTCRKDEGIVALDASGKVASIVKVVSVEGGKVRVGIDASADVKLLRTTIYERIYGKPPSLESAFDAAMEQRTPHPATHMTPVRSDIDEVLHSDPVGRHD